MVVKSQFVSTTQTNKMLFKQYDKRKEKFYVKIVVELSYQSCRNGAVKCKKLHFFCSILIFYLIFV